jgi:phytoene synthase
VTAEFELQAAQALCQEITHRRGANFSVGFRFLPPHKRDAVYAAYAFCRYADDVADLHGDPPGGPAEAALDRWEQELERIYAGRPTERIGVALVHALDSFPIPQSAFLDLIRGCRDDVSGRRYHTFEELLGYCALVAEPIGRICISIFGAVAPQADELGRSLSRALQLTNILRDVGEDARLGRCYLPLQELASCNVDPQCLADGEVGEGFEQLMRWNIGRARRFYQEAAALPAALEPDARVGVSLMAAVYREVLRHIEQRPRRVLLETTALTDSEKEMLVARHLQRRLEAGETTG